MSKILAAVNQRLALKIGLICLAAVLSAAVFASLTNPLVTYDSWQYLSSGVSIASGEFPKGYFLIREPAYPLILSLASIFDLSLRWVVGFQFLLFVGGLVLNLKVLSWDSSQNNPQRWRGVGVVSVFVLFGGYATFIGQQILIYFVLSLAVFSVTRVRMISQPRHKILLLAFVGFLGGLTSIFLWITMAIFFVFEFLRRTFQSKTRREKPNSLLVALSLVIGATVALAPWQILRSSVPEFDSQVKSESLVSQGIFGPYKKLIQNGVPIEVGVISSFLSNLDLIPNQGWGLDITYSEAMPGNPNFYFGSAPLFGLTPDCVSIPSGGVDQVSEPTIQKFENCDSPETPATIPTIVKSIWSGFHLLASTSILLAIFFGSRKHATTISVETFTLVIAFLLSYSLMLGGIPRYGMPSQVILILVGLSHLTELMRRVQWPVK